MKQLLIFLIVLFGFSNCHNRRFETITIRGSDTEVNVVLRLAEIFMDSVPDVSIAVTGGGSGTGIASLINKKTDIANSSRAFKPSEIQLAASRGVEVIPIIFAVDALTFIVQEDLPMNALTLAEIRAIFTGEIDNWSAFGLEDQKISLYGRQANSGTFNYIQQMILKGDYSNQMKQMNGTSQIIEGVRNDRAGIGYAGIGYVLQKDGTLIDGVKILHIQTRKDESLPIDPTQKINITTGKYPIVRPLYQYLDGLPNGLLRDFILFELSPKGQAIIEYAGYFSITEAQSLQNQKFLFHE